MSMVPRSVGLYDELPRRLYKFMTAFHAESTVCSGVFRIGSLAEYRNVELFQDDIGDAGEGTAVLKDSRMATQNEETMSWPMRQIFKTEPNTGITIRNCIARIDWTLDLYIYCMHGSTAGRFRHRLNTTPASRSGTRSPSWMRCQGLFS